MNENMDKKEQRLRRQLRKDPEEVENYAKLGKYLFLSRRYQAASEIYLQGLKLFPDSRVLLLNLGVVREAQDRDAEARELYIKVLELDPNSEAAAERLEKITAF